VLIPLVARAGVLAEAGSVLTAARAGRGALLTVTGEPGIGKTRLAEEAAGQADGFEVIWTWCPAATGGAALRPWSRVIRVLAGGHTAAARLIADSPFLAALADPARSGDARDPEGARSQLSFDLAEVFAVAAAKRPVLVIIDDAHQADVSSLRLLTELAPALRTMPAAVLVTARDGDRDWHGRLDMRTALLRSGDVISLQPLAEGDVAAVVAGVTGAPAGPELVGVIAERSAGNPFLVTELARQLAERNAEPAAARAIVPDSVRALAGARVGELTGTARDVVLAASVLGTRFRRDVLAGLTGLEPGELAAALSAGRDTSLLQLAEPGEDQLRHDLVRDAIYDSIPADAREGLHTRAGGVLASLAGRGRDVDDAEVAYHLAPHPAARWAYDALSPYAGLIAVEGICAAIRGPVDHHLALLADALGEHEAAARHRAAAVAGARVVGALALAAASRGRPRPFRFPRADHAFHRHGEVWTLAYRGREIRMRDSKGLRDLDALLARPGTAVAALDLASAPGGHWAGAPGGHRAGAPAGPDVLHPPSDAGEIIDAQARAAYRQRLRELDEAAAEAGAAADIERSARIAAERDALVAALTEAYGLGGRARRSGSAAERARTAVTARIRDAIRRISEAHPELGRHLARSVRTGTFCVYDPDQPVRWSL
jgi:hypothetical protein